MNVKKPKEMKVITLANHKGCRQSWPVNQRRCKPNTIESSSWHKSIGKELFRASHDWIWLYFSQWMEKWHKILSPITKHSTVKPGRQTQITFHIQVTTALEILLTVTVWVNLQQLDLQQLWVMKRSKHASISGPIPHFLILQTGTDLFINGHQENKLQIINEDQENKNWIHTILMRITFWSIN